jgi:ribosome-associated protein
MQTFNLYTEYITLAQLLKATGIAERGSDAKEIVREGGFKVNGEAEERPGRKLRKGDIVTSPNGEKIEVQSD